jgi:hypothetical protein
MPTLLVGERGQRKSNKASIGVLKDIELAMLANGGDEFIEEFCFCDSDVGMVPCQYCAIQRGLKRAKEFIVSLEAPNE